MGRIEPYTSHRSYKSYLGSSVKHAVQHQMGQVKDRGACEDQQRRAQVGLYDLCD